MVQECSPRPHSPVSLGTHRLQNLKIMNWNLPTPTLYEEALKRNEAIMAHLGPLVVRTGQYTGRSPNDKFIVTQSIKPTLVIEPSLHHITPTVCWQKFICGLDCSLNFDIFTAKVFGV